MSLRLTAWLIAAGLLLFGIFAERAQGASITITTPDACAHRPKIIGPPGGPYTVQTGCTDPHQTCTGILSAPVPGKPQTLTITCKERK